jgi:hypothetical protein
MYAFSHFTYVRSSAKCRTHYSLLCAVVRLCFVTTELPWLGMEFGIGSGLNLFYCVGLDCFVFYLSYSYPSSTLDAYRWIVSPCI